MSIDYMHGILLGIGRLLLRLWIQACNHLELWYIGDQITTIDDRLCSITPPNEIQRTPRSIELTVKFWKGSYIHVVIYYLAISFLQLYLVYRGIKC